MTSIPSAECSVASFSPVRGRPSSSSGWSRKDGTARDVEAVVSNQTHRPSVAGYVANIRDITERKKFEALLAHRAFTTP